MGSIIKRIIKVAFGSRSTTSYNQSTGKVTKSYSTKTSPSTTLTRTSRSDGTVKQTTTVNYGKGTTRKTTSTVSKPIKLKKPKSMKSPKAPKMKVVRIKGSSTPKRRSKKPNIKW